MKRHLTRIAVLAMIAAAFAAMACFAPAQHALFAADLQMAHGDFKSDGSASTAFDAIAAKHGVENATTRLLTDNMESWYARWHIVSNAKRSIDITSFIVDRDAFGLALLGLLQKKAKEGVKVRFMLDARGAMVFSEKMKGQDYLQEIARWPGVEIKVYNPLHQNVLALFANPRHIVCSNHDKIFLVDGEWCITGGRNIARNYFTSAADHAYDNYEDTDILMRGAKTAAAMKMAFDEEFDSHSTFTVRPDAFGNFKSRAAELELARLAMERFMSGMGLFDTAKVSDAKLRKSLEALNTELSRYKSMTGYASYRPFSGDRATPSVVLDKHSFKGTRNDITPALISLINSAKKEIIIQNPYFVVTDEAMTALRAADARGVSIIVQTNSAETSEKPMTLAFFVNEWEKLLVALPRCRMFVFKGEGKLHSKVFVFDREVAVISSYNMDPMSEQINSEIAVAVKSPEFALRSALRVRGSISKSLEYRMRRDKNGRPVPSFGPESHTDPKVLEGLKRIYRLPFLRPLV